MYPQEAKPDIFFKNENKYIWEWNLNRNLNTSHLTERKKTLQVNILRENYCHTWQKGSKVKIQFWQYGGRTDASGWKTKKNRPSSYSDNSADFADHYNGLQSHLLHIKGSHHGAAVVPWYQTLTFTAAHSWFCKQAESERRPVLSAQYSHLWSLGPSGTVQGPQKSPDCVSAPLPMLVWKR